MDALSTPAASALGLGGFLSTPPREPALALRRPHPPSPSVRSHLHGRHYPLGPGASAASPGPLPPAASCRPRRPASPPLHRKASTGYAAALLDAAQRRGAVAAVERDVRRFSVAARHALTDASLGEGEKGESVRRVAESGGFCVHLVTLVRMLVGRGKVNLVGEVMEEFAKIHDELTGTRAVYVTSERRMGPGQLAGIARQVRRVTGAAMVRLRHAYRRL